MYCCPSFLWQSARNGVNVLQVTDRICTNQIGINFNFKYFTIHYTRRILSMGAHSCELYCNLGLCCLYGGQIDLVLPCFQRALRLAITAEQRADVWYNLSFVAMVRERFIE